MASYTENTIDTRQVEYWLERDRCLPTKTRIRGFRPAFTYNSIVEINDVSIEEARIGMYVGSGSQLTGRRLVVENTTEYGVAIQSQARVTITGSHILPASGLAIWTDSFLYDLVIHDFSGNFWGVSDPDSIAAMIEDGNDNPSINSYVQFLPFSGEVVPTKQSSWGSLKAMFR
jgi:hypothetical protein